MPRPKPPAEVAVGEWVTAPFDADAFTARYNTTMSLIAADAHAGTLPETNRHVMALALATAASLAHEIDLRRLPLVREYDDDGQPVTEAGGRKVRPKHRPFKEQLFARDVITAWEAAELPCEIYDNENGQSPLVYFTTTLARALKIIQPTQSMVFALRKAKNFTVTTY